MKRIEREKVIRNAYRSTILALTICCFFLGTVLVIHEAARELNYMYVSGGRLGMQIKLKPVDLQKASGASFADVIHS